MITDEGDIFAAEDDLLAQASAAEAASAEELGTFEALGLRGALRPGALRRRRVRPRRRGARRLRGGDGLPRHPRAARARPGARPAAPAAERPAPGSAVPRTAEELVRDVSTHEQLATLRRELNGLVAAWNHRTGQPHGVTHAALRKECGGPAAADRHRRPAAEPDRPDPRLGRAAAQRLGSGHGRGDVTDAGPRPPGAAGPRGEPRAG